MGFRHVVTPAFYFLVPFSPVVWRMFRLKPYCLCIAGRHTVTFQQYKIERRNGQEGHLRTIIFPRGFAPVFVVPARGFFGCGEWGRGIKGGSGQWAHRAGDRGGPQGPMRSSTLRIGELLTTRGSATAATDTYTYTYTRRHRRYRIDVRTPTYPHPDPTYPAVVLIYMAVAYARCG